MKKNTKNEVKQSVKAVKSVKTTKPAKVDEKVAKVGCEVRFGKTQMSVSKDGYKASLRPAKNHILLKEKMVGAEPVSRRLVKASLGGAKKTTDGVWNVRLAANEGATEVNFGFATRKDALEFKKSFTAFFTK